MRYFRVTLNPLSAIVLSGPGGNSCSIRMRFALTDQMIYATFVDGGWVAVEDADMGQWGAVADFLNSGPDTIPPYLLMQEGVPQGVPLASIPLWSDHLVPYDASPAAQPVIWPATEAIPG